VKLVVDASVAVKWLVPEEYSDLALKLLKNFAEGAVELHAPLLLKYEVYNSLRTYVSRNIVAMEDAYKLSSIFSQIELNYHEPSWESLQASLKQALEYGITVYDTVYIALARELGTVLITADKYLYQKAVDTGVEITYLPQIET